jgi:limonene-1,2-epoxide hydrolase
MGEREEGTVREFIKEQECEGSWDDAQIDRIVSRMAPDARRHVVAWHDPIVGHDANRAQLLREAAVIRDLRIEILKIGSIGPIVFTERIDSMIWRGTPAASHIAGVFEVDGEGKVAAWRDYLDTRELSVQMGKP